MKRFISLLFLTTLLLSACSSATSTPAVSAPTQAVAAAPVDRKLHATDPTTVKLASGGPQLVEFFAFW
jgi:PBP1b-binding outer membrane lipoprotein LpoB